MIEIGKRSLFDFHGIKKNTPLLHHLAKGARRILPGMLCDQNALHLKTPFELHTHKVCSLQRRKGKNCVIMRSTFLIEVYPNYLRFDHNSHRALSLELNNLTRPHLPKKRWVSIAMKTPSKMRPVTASKAATVLWGLPGRKELEKTRP